MSSNFRSFQVNIKIHLKSVKAKIWGTYMTKKRVINHNQTSHE